MIVLREEFYFEPRCIGSSGNIRWYGEVYNTLELQQHSEETVYIRDNGQELYVYKLSSDDNENQAKIKAVFTLICKVKKNSDKWRYGKKNG